MFSTFFTIALFVAPAIQGVFAFAINSPTLTQCKSARISWEPTKGPYNLIVVKASDPCGNALVEVGDFTKTFIDWTANVAAGTEVQLSLIDANDQEAWSNTITVGENSDASCLITAAANVAASSSAPAASASSTPSSGSSPTPGSTGPSDGSSSPDSSDTVPAPVGAANAGKFDSTSAAFTLRQASTPLMLLTGLAAAFALSL